MFAKPTASDLHLLATKYKVRWLFVDARGPADLAGLRKVADLRYHRGRYWVFQVPSS